MKTSLAFNTSTATAILCRLEKTEYYKFLEVMHTQDNVGVITFDTEKCPKLNEIIVGFQLCRYLVRDGFEV